MDEGSYEGGWEVEKAFIPGALPNPAKETPPWAEDIMCRIAEAEQIKEVGRSPSSLLTWQLAQMAGQTRPSTSGGEEPARRKLRPTVGGKAPWKEFLQAGMVKKTRQKQPGTVGLWEIWWFQKSTELLI